MAELSKKFDGNVALMRNKDGDWYIIMRRSKGSNKYACYNIKAGYVSNGGDFITKDATKYGKEYLDIEAVLKKVIEGRD